MEKQWIQPLSVAGWSKVTHIKFPLYSRIIDGKVYFSAMPDVGQGIMPVNIPSKLIPEADAYMRTYSTNIYIGDFAGRWHVEGYKSMPIPYQVIPRNPKVEKEARNQAKYALKTLTIGPSTDREGYWACTQETAKRQGREPINEYVFDALCDAFMLITAVYKSKTIAGCLVGNEKVMQYVHSASLTEFLHLRPNHGIMATLIGADREIRLGNAPTELKGLHDFKKSFGAISKSFNLKYYEI